MQPSLVALVALVIAEALISTVVLVLILRSVLRTRRLPVIAGRIRALSGPFEALGIEPMVVAGLVFVSLSSLKFLAAWWLASGQADGAVLQLCLLGASAVFWYGFAVPYGPVLGIPQVVLIVLVWPSLTQYGIGSGAAHVDDRVAQDADPLDRISTSSPAVRLNDSGGTIPVPVMRKQPRSNAIARPSQSTRSSRRRWIAAVDVSPANAVVPPRVTDSRMPAGSERSGQATMHGPIAQERSYTLACGR